MIIDGNLKPKVKEFYHKHEEELKPLMQFLTETFNPEATGMLVLYMYLMSKVGRIKNHRIEEFHQFLVDIEDSEDDLWH